MVWAVRLGFSGAFLALGCLSAGGGGGEAVLAPSRASGLGLEGLSGTCVGQRREGRATSPVMLAGASPPPSFRAGAGERRGVGAPSCEPWA